MELEWIPTYCSMQSEFMIEYLWTVKSEQTGKRPRMTHCVGSQGVSPWLHYWEEDLEKAWRISEIAWTSIKDNIHWLADTWFCKDIHGIWAGKIQCFTANTMKETTQSLKRTRNICWSMWWLEREISSIILSIWRLDIWFLVGDIVSGSHEIPRMYTLARGSMPLGMGFESE